MKRKNFGIRVENGNAVEIIDWLVKQGYFNILNSTGMNVSGMVYYVGDDNNIYNTDASMCKHKIYSLSELMQEQYKKLSGYKLVNGNYVNCIDLITGYYHFEGEIIKNYKFINKLNEAGVLNLWFEPVYEKESLVESILPNIDKSPYTMPSGNVVGEKKKDYKVGDWVVPIYESWERFNLHNRKKGSAYLVKEINANRVILFQEDNRSYEGNGVIDFHAVRVALKWDIEAAIKRGEELNKELKTFLSEIETKDIKTFLSEIKNAITTLENKIK